MRIVSVSVACAVSLSVVAIAIGQLPRVEAQEPVAIVDGQLGPTIVTAAWDPNTFSIDVTLHNAGAKPIQALSLDLSASLSSGHVKRTEYAMDYVQSQESPAARGVQPGASRALTIPYRLSEGTFASEIHVSVAALLFEDGEAIGAEESVTRVFDRRASRLRAYLDATRQLEDLQRARPAMSFDELVSAIGDLRGPNLQPSNTMFLVNDMTALRHSTRAQPFALAAAAINRNMEKLSQGLRRR